jgi:hypothetical protein
LPSKSPKITPFSHQNPPILPIKSLKITIKTPRYTTEKKARGWLEKQFARELAEIRAAAAAKKAAKEG